MAKRQKKVGADEETSIKKRHNKQPEGPRCFAAESYDPTAPEKDGTLWHLSGGSFHRFPSSHIRYQTAQVQFQSCTQKNCAAPSVIIPCICNYMGQGKRQETEGPVKSCKHRVSKVRLSACAVAAASGHIRTRPRWWSVPVHI